MNGIADDAQRRHAAGLMRINHAGEVCAQALYLGQAAVSRSADTRRHLLQAADEEDRYREVVTFAQAHCTQSILFGVSAGRHE